MMKNFTMIERKPSEREWTRSAQTDEGKKHYKRKVRYNAHDRATLSMLHTILG